VDDPQVPPAKAMPAGWDYLGIPNIGQRKEKMARFKE